MLTPEAEAELEKQQYRIIGSHSAVKPCGWTKTMIRGSGGCYKLKFYGIKSNQCLQMTTSISCANRCVFCWRGYKAPVSKEWNWAVDDPQMIFQQSQKAHQQLLVGFRGSPSANQELYAQSKEIKHVALSLTGEAIIYPRINELIDLFHQAGISTFLVTNAQYPKQIKELKPITQLYLSVDAPTPELLKEVDKPLFSDYWERLLQSLDYLAEKKGRTCLRLTILKGINDCYPEKYAELINRSKTCFLEVKSYMFVGESRKRLKKENMPLHEEIVGFSRKLEQYLPDYELVSEHIPSRVVMFARKEFKQNGVWKTWIDFEQFVVLVNSDREFTSLEYSQNTPKVGLSGQGTLDQLRNKDKREELQERLQSEGKIYVDEKTHELDFFSEE